MQMAFRFLLSPPTPPLPNNPAAAASASSSSYLVPAQHRRPPEPRRRCRCGRSPEVTSSSGDSGSGDRELYEEEDSATAAGRPVEPDGGTVSGDREIGSAAPPRYQATSTEGDNSTNGNLEGLQKNQLGTNGFSSSMSKSGYSKAFEVDLSPDNVAVATVYFVQGVLGLSRLAVSFYLKDNLQLDPAEVWQ